jgi:DNA-repair protein XRCC2
VIFDTDGTFNVSRLQELLRHRLTRLSVGSLAVEDLATAAMKRVLIFRPTSSVQLAASLLNLPAYHMAHLPDDEIGFVAIDSISSFYWPDRFTLEQMTSSGNTRRGKSNAASPMHHVLIALQKFRKSHGPVIALTNWGLNPLTQPTQHSTPATLYKQHLFPFPTLPKQDQSNAPYTSEDHSASHYNPNTTALPPLTHHITLPFVHITPFGPGLRLEDAKEQESKYRRELVTNGEVVGVVRTSGSRRVGRFTFRIGAHEVLVDDLGP